MNGCCEMTDVQSMKDERRIPIKKVGVKGLRYPITVLDRANSLQHTTALVNLYADLPHDFKGTHMSRFIEVFNEHRRCALPVLHRESSLCFRTEGYHELRLFLCGQGFGY